MERVNRDTDAVFLKKERVARHPAGDDAFRLTVVAADSEVQHQYLG